MEPYNVKILTYPDLSKRVKIYSKAVESPNHCPPVRSSNPFDKNLVLNVNDFDEHFAHSREVSYKRTLQSVYDYAKSNVWDYFVTFTFSPKKVNRYDYDECTKKLSQWIKNLKKLSPTLSYLIVPERHKDGAYHFHGLFAGLSDRELVWTGKYVIKRSGGKFVRTKDKIYRFGHYKLGWMTATKVKDMDRVTSYITKYITKDMMGALFGRKRYWASRNLLKPAEEVLLMDGYDLKVFSDDLSEISRYKKVSVAEYGELTQRVEIFDLG